jgi:hypothetical protein
MGKGRSGSYAALPRQDLPDSIQVLDQEDNEFTKCWLISCKRLKTKKLIDAITFNDVIASYTSASFFCEPYRKFALLLNLDVTATPTDIVIRVEVSDDNAKWYQYMNGPFGDIRYEDSAGDKLEAILGELRSSYVRLRAVATGTTAANTFKLTAKLICET